MNIFAYLYLLRGCKESDTTEQLTLTDRLAISFANLFWWSVCSDLLSIFKLGHVTFCWIARIFIFWMYNFFRNVLQIFTSQSVVCLFILLIVFFNRRNFNLVTSNLPIYISLYAPFWANFSQRYKVVFRLFFVSVSGGVLHEYVQMF